MITTHVLDTAAGRPARDVPVALAIRRGNDWLPVADGRTDHQGRLATLTSPDATAPGVYRLTFDLAAYRHDGAAFFPHVQVVFALGTQEEHVHIPLLVSPFGYTTYRGA
jgi:5-hydroxyisourate hydrolase